ncbi:hypothetical protein EDD90_1850 [Streptomyces sp. Ag109_O5-1]|nr:hypothetical protein EDD90_1850 [Streptomyces sp. Ag109_O5-1]
MARFRTWLGIAVAGALSATLAGCSSTGGKRAEDARNTAAAQRRAAVNTPRWTVAMITHSGDGDTFWDIVQNGAEQAARKDNRWQAEATLSPYATNCSGARGAGLFRCAAPPRGRDQPRTTRTRQRRGSHLYVPRTALRASVRQNRAR